MKLRDGFVSNSSSSSFLIIGTTDERLIDKLLEAKNLTREQVTEEMSFGYFYSDDINFLGYDEITYAGAELEEIDLDKMPLLILKQNLSKKIKEKYNVTIPIEKLNLYYGEVGSG